MAEGGALKAPCSLQGLDRALCRDSSPLSSGQVTPSSQVSLQKAHSPVRDWRGFLAKWGPWQVVE